MRTGVFLASLCFCAHALAQFPLVRTLEVRTGQRRPAIKHVVQDAQGLLWVGTSEGLLRTDGDRVETLLPMDGSTIRALTAGRTGVVLATSGGELIACDGAGCDTLVRDTLWRTHPITSLAMDAQGVLWVGTYGRGLCSIANGMRTVIDQRNGLPDDHVNDLDLLPDGRVAVATDQGLAICRGAEVLSRMGEAEGAPDNLTLSIDATASGSIWAGTDRSGVFLWKLDEGPLSVLTFNDQWAFGPVHHVRAVGDMVWVGTEEHGPIAKDLSLRQGTYRLHGAAPTQVQDLLLDKEGAVWWCDGTELLHRADPAFLFVPEHEGLDLRHITALCTDPLGRIWFATADGLFNHVAYFSEERTVTRVPVPLDPRAPIVSLASDADGNVWAATFGTGVYRVRTNGAVEHYTTAQGLSNDNVLSARWTGDKMLFATLAGVTVYDGQRFAHIGEDAGFVFDVAAVDSTVYMATDGNGVRYTGRTGNGQLAKGKSTYYTLLKDDTGALWSGGPGTGFCLVATDGTKCTGAEVPPFDGDLFAMGAVGRRIIAFGSTGATAYDPASGSLTDITSTFGLEGISAELNTIASDASGALWFGCSKGLVRMRPTAAHFDRNVAVSILSVRLGNEVVPADSAIRVMHDRNTFTVRFTGLHYADPAAVRFEHRLLGLDSTVFRTRDREVSFAALPPGDYVFGVRATLGDQPGDGAWTEVRFSIAQPWWRTFWAVGGAVLLVILIVLLLVRAREQRIRYRDRMEQEKVRFQLDALRSQVDPHFLFNSFNALVELIESDPAIAVQHVEQLSNFFRSILQLRDRERISLGEELDLLRNYFALEQRRFGAGVRLHIEVSGTGTQQGIVPLTLQLLVENALKHNVISGGAEVFTITVREVDDHIEVENPLRPKLTAPRSTGFGIDSITRRYAALTPRPVQVVRDQQRFTVRIPLIDPGA